MIEIDGTAIVIDEIAIAIGVYRKIEVVQNRLTPDHARGLNQKDVLHHADPVLDLVPDLSPAPNEAVMSNPSNLTLEM